MVVTRHTVRSLCECQAVLSAELDEARRVVRGWARDRDGAMSATAPATSLGAESEDFQVAWMCPFCTRNVLRSVSASGLLPSPLAIDGDEQ